MAPQITESFSAHGASLPQNGTGDPRLAEGAGPPGTPKLLKGHLGEGTPPWAAGPSWAV